MRAYFCLLLSLATAIQQPPPITPQWVEFVGTNDSNTYCYTSVTGFHGTTYISGMTNGNLYAPLKGQYDYYLAAFDAQGKFLCGHQNGGANGSGEAKGRGVGFWTDPTTAESFIFLSGQIIGGYFENQPNSTAPFKYWLAKYRINTCEFIWLQQFEKENLNPEASGLAIDTVDHSLYITGSCKGGYFLAKHNVDGTLIWFGTPTFAPGSVHGIVVDRLHNIYLCGFAETNDVTIEYFISGWNEIGDLLWSQQLGSSDGMVVCDALALDSKQNYLYMTGLTKGSLSDQPKVGFHDYYIAKYDINGRLQWIRQGGSPPNGDCRGYKIAVDSTTDIIYTAGRTNQSLSEQPMIGLTDIYIATYLSEGSLLDINQYGFSDQAPFVFGLVNVTGGLYLAGHVLDQSFFEAYVTKLV